MFIFNELKVSKLKEPAYLYYFIRLIVGGDS